MKWVALVCLVLLVPGALADTSDFSGSGFDLTIQGDPVLVDSQEAVTGLGYSFDGDDCLLGSLQAADRVGDFSFMAIVDTTAGGGTTIVAHPKGASDDSRGATLVISENQIRFLIGHDASPAFEALDLSVTLTGVSNVIATYDDSTRLGSVYLDGELIGSQTFAGNIQWADGGGTSPSAGQFYLGAVGASAGSTACSVAFQEGISYEVRTFSSVLASDEIAALQECEQREILFGSEVRFYHFGETGYACPEETASGGAPFGDTGFFYGGDKQGMADDLGLTVLALEAWTAVIMMASLAWLFGRRFGKVGAAAGAFVGFVAAVVFALFDVWVVVFVLFVLVAIGIGKARSSGGPV